MRFILSILIVFVSIAMTNFSFAGDSKAGKSVEAKSVQNRGEIDTIKCDAYNDAKLRVGDNCTFDITFTSNGPKYKISDVNYWFWEDIDYNKGENSLKFLATKEFIDSNGVVENGTMKLMVSNDYDIRIPPEKRSKENIIVKYEILFNEIIPNKGLSQEQHRLVQCARYTITRCGDGVVDKQYGEECDDGVNGSATCSKNCKRK